MTKQAFTPLDEWLHANLLDGFKAYQVPANEVADLAKRQIQTFDVFGAQLNDAYNHAQKNPGYLDLVISKESRDCFLLCFDENPNAFAFNQIQARLELEGQANTAYSLVRDQLLKSLDNYRVSLRKYKDLFKVYQSEPKNSLDS